MANQSGTGSTNVIFSYDANPDAKRSGTLTIAGQTLTVTQAGATYVAAPSVATTLASSGLTNPWYVEWMVRAASILPMAPITRSRGGRL